MNSGKSLFSAQERLLQQIDEGALILDASGTIVWANRAAGELFGEGNDLSGNRLGNWLCDPHAVEELVSTCALARNAPAGLRSRTVVAAAKRTGLDLLFSVGSCQAGEPCTLVVKPFHEAISSFDRTISFATRDGVTQLLNREAFEETLAGAAMEPGSVVAICASVDQFPTINDVYGHAAGDDLLRTVAQRLRSISNSATPIGRMYGGRFALFLREAGEVEATRAAEATVSKLHRAFVAPVTVAGGQHTMTLSVGIAVTPRDATTGAELLSAAETAIRAVANEGAGKTSWFRSTMLSERRRALEIESDLRQAIANGDLTLHYQPKVRQLDRRIVGFEALVRWNHSLKGMMSPAEFVPVAEKCDLIDDLGIWVMREACRQLAQWRAQGLSILPVAVNVSPRQILSQSLDALLAPLTEFGLPPNCIEIEITESALMDRLTAAPAAIAALRRAGVQISIDDFGTGHSSLANLRRLPINTLKIDRSFVEDIEASREAHDIVATIIAMANTLSLEIVAEGVETESQAEMLHRLGANLMQGYLFARPMPAAKASLLLQHQESPIYTRLSASA